MVEKELRVLLVHEHGATDELLTRPARDAFVPRKGEFVTYKDVIKGYVFDVNYDFGLGASPTATATAYVACDGEPDRCDWDCSRDHVREYSEW